MNAPTHDMQSVHAPITTSRFYTLELTHIPVSMPSTSNQCDIMAQERTPMGSLPPQVRHYSRTAIFVYSPACVMLSATNNNNACMSCIQMCPLIRVEPNAMLLRAVFTVRTKGYDLRYGDTGQRYHGQHCGVGRQVCRRQAERGKQDGWLL